MTCQFEHSDAPYVLGSLSAVERLEFEQHLAECDACTARVRQLAGLPGLLGRVRAEVLQEPALPPVPDTVLPTLARAVRRSQARRTWLTAGVAAAVAAVVVGLGAVAVSTTGSEGERPATAPTVTVTPTPTDPTPADPAPSDPAPSRPMEPVGEVPLEARLTLEPVTWGTRIGLECTYDPSWVPYDLPAEATYLLVVRTRGGATEQVGTWRSVGGKTMRLEAATATPSSDIASVEVRTTDGRVVLTSRA